MGRPALWCPTAVLTAPREVGSGDSDDCLVREISRSVCVTAALAPARCALSNFCHSLPRDGRLRADVKASKTLQGLPTPDAAPF